MEYPANNLNNSGLEDANYNRKRKLIIVGVVVIFLIIFGIVIALGDKSGNKKDIPNIDTAGRYKDPNSGQTVSDPPDKAPDLYGRNTDAPIFLGDTKLMDHGITNYQRKDFQFGVYAYFQSQKKNISEVSVDVSTIALKQHDSESASTIDTAFFDVVIDRKDRYKVQMDYYDLTAIHMYMNDSTGKKVYDSGELNNVEIIPVEHDSYAN